MPEVPASGLAGYTFRIVTSDNIAFVDYQSSFALNRRDGDEISAVDLNKAYQGGELDVVLGTITIEARALGPALVIIETIRLDDDQGEHIEATFIAPQIEVIP